MKDAQKLPVRVDPIAMAEKGQALNGLLNTDLLKRLKNTTLSMDPVASVILDFSKNEQAFPLLTGSIKLNLVLRCERCLDEMQLSIDHVISLYLVSKSENRVIDEGVEYYEYEENGLILSDILEDELLLALPLVPKHQDISLCNQDMIAWLAANDQPERKSVNPFAILKR